MSTPANSINEATTGICGFTGTAFTATPVTQYNVIVGSSTTSTLTNVAPHATVGVPLVSVGASADPAFGTAVVAGGGTGLTSTTAYAVLCGGTTTTAALQSIAGVGTAAQVLTSNGAGALPTFQAAAGGGGDWVLISSATASASATIAFTGLSSTYFAYKIIIDNLQPAADDDDFWMRTSTDAGVSYDSGTSDYDWALKWVRASTTNSTGEDGDNADAKMVLNYEANGFGTATAELGSYEITLYNPSSATRTYISYQMFYEDSAGDAYWTSGGGRRLATADVDAIQFLFSSDNLATGNFRLYGMVAA